MSNKFKGYKIAKLEFEYFKDYVLLIESKY